MPWWGRQDQDLRQATWRPAEAFLTSAFQTWVAVLWHFFWRAIFIIIICLGLINFFPNYKRNPCSLQKMSSQFVTILLICRAFRLSDEGRRARVLNSERPEFKLQVCNPADTQLPARKGLLLLLPFRIRETSLVQLIRQLNKDLCKIL